VRQVHKAEARLSSAIHGTGLYLTLISMCRMCIICLGSGGHFGRIMSARPGIERYEVKALSRSLSQRMVILARLVDQRYTTKMERSHRKSEVRLCVQR
jgi:hypothetical protein